MEDKVFFVWGLEIPWLVPVTFFVMAFLTVLGWLATRKMSCDEPGGLQNLMEAVMEFLLNLVKNSAGEHVMDSFKYIATLFLFILTANMVGLFVPQVNSPTASLPVTLGLAASVLILTVYYGIRNKGLKEYLAHFFKPHWLFFPLNVFELFIKPLSMALRLFGNIFAGEMMLYILYSIALLYSISALVIWAWQSFSIFIGVIQAYLFALLALAYIADAAEKDETEAGS
ncbi:MAG: F0F1 ATP synthase subunit A [Bacillota bacterium]